METCCQLLVEQPVDCPSGGDALVHERGPSVHKLVHRLEAHARFEGGDELVTLARKHGTKLFEFLAGRLELGL